MMNQMLKLVAPPFRSMDSDCISSIDAKNSTCPDHILYEQVIQQVDDDKI